MYSNTNQPTNEALRVRTDYSTAQNRQIRPTYPMMPDLPTGRPTGPSPIPIPQVPTTPTVPPNGQAPQTLESTLYTPGYLRTLIGRNIRVEFLIGTNAPLIDRTGVLLGVGASYILIRPTDTDDVMLCDIYSIKFVTVFY